MPSASPLAVIEPRLRPLLPANLYAAAWVEPSPAHLTQVFEHLRTLRRLLHDYTPRLVSDSPAQPGEIRHDWQEGTLMFTDLAGFTPLMEANATLGRAGAGALLGTLNAYFAAMLEIISKAGGNLLEFTGDAMLVQFSADQRSNDTAKAVRAGLRMQRAMERFANIQTTSGSFALGMRIGLHTGRFLTADIGTPRRMEHVLLGTTVQQTKRAEGSGDVGRVCLTTAAQQRVQALFRYEPARPGHVLVVDDLDDHQLGEYDLVTFNRRAASGFMLDRSVEGLVREITEALTMVEPLASYLPLPVLNLLIESAAHRKIAPQLPELVVMFVKITGLPDALDQLLAAEEPGLVSSFSRLFALINAEVESQGGVLKNATCDEIGSDMLIYFGAPSAHSDDPLRAALTALGIRQIVATLAPVEIGGQPTRVSCQIGISSGPAFTAEIGEPRGRREFNILGDTVNTASRVMSRAAKQQILLTHSVKAQIDDAFECEHLGQSLLKGKAAAQPLFALHRALEVV